MKRFFDSQFFILLIILVSVIFIRFNRVFELGYFMIDEERDGFLVRRMLVDHRPLLIGGSIPGGINVGPAFFYISAIPYYLSRLNPVGPAWAAAVVGIIGVIGVFWVGKELFGRRAGILAAVLAGFSLVNIIYQRPWWPLTMSQVVTLVAYLSLFRLSVFGYRLSDKGRSVVSLSGTDKQKTDKLQSENRKQRTDNRYLLILVVALIFGAQSDPSTLSLIPLSIIWLRRHRRRIELTGKHYLAAVGLFLLTHATWVVFEFRHDFMSTRAFFGLLKGLSLAYAKESPFWIFLSGPAAVLKMTAATLYRLFIPTGPLDVTKQISPAEIFLSQRLTGIWWPGATAMLLVIGSYVISSLVRSLLKGPTLPWQGRTLISLHFLISLAGILVYTSVFPGYVHEWMWFFMFGGFFLMAGDLLVRLAKLGKFAELVISMAVLGWAIWQMGLLLKLENVAGLGEKLRVVQTAQAEIAGRPYELQSEGEGALRYGGWRYLFTLYGDPPVKSYMDYVYQDWVYPKNELIPEVIVVINNQVGVPPTFSISEHSENSENQISSESRSP